MFLVVSTSAIDCLKRLVTKMTYGIMCRVRPLNPTHFNFLAVTVFEIRYDISHIYIRGRCAPKTPLAKKIEGPNFTLGALHPGTPLAEKLSFPKSALDAI